MDFASINQEINGREDNSWRSSSFRRAIQNNIHDVIGPLTISKQSLVELENSVYLKAKNKEEYLNFAACLKIHVREITRTNKVQSRIETLIKALQNISTDELKNIPLKDQQAEMTATTEIQEPWLQAWLNQQQQQNLDHQHLGNIGPQQTFPDPSQNVGPSQNIVGNAMNQPGPRVGVNSNLGVNQPQTNNTINQTRWTSQIMDFSSGPHARVRNPEPETYSNHNSEIAEGNSWRSPSFRHSVVNKINEALRSLALPPTKNAVEFENQVFTKARNKDEYLSYVARLIIHVREMNHKNQNLDGGNNFQSFVQQNRPLVIPNTSVAIQENQNVQPQVIGQQLGTTNQQYSHGSVAINQEMNGQTTQNQNLGMVTHNRNQMNSSQMNPNQIVGAQNYFGISSNQSRFNPVIYQNPGMLNAERDQIYYSLLGLEPLSGNAADISWQLPSFRQSVVNKINESIRRDSFDLMYKAKSVDIENSVFTRSRNSHEYLSSIATLVVETRESIKRNARISYLKS